MKKQKMNKLKAVLIYTMRILGIFSFSCPIIATTYVIWNSGIFFLIEKLDVFALNCSLIIFGLMLFVISSILKSIWKRRDDR